MDALTENFRRLANIINNEHTFATVTTFPTGSVMLDVRIYDRLFVMVYSSSILKYGVDEYCDSEGFDSEYQFSYTSFNSAKEKLLQLLSEVNSGSSP